MGRVNPTPGRGFAVRLALFRVDASDLAAIKASAYDGDAETVAPGVRVFRRSDDRVFAVQRVSAATVGGTRYVLAVVYVPGASRDAQAPFSALVDDLGVDLVKSWPVVLNADGTLRVPALDSDGTAVGTGVKSSLWPASWRVRLAADAGDPLASPPVPPTAPSGPRCVGSVLA